MEFQWMVAEKMIINDVNGDCITRLLEYMRTMDVYTLHTEIVKRRCWSSMDVLIIVIALIHMTSERGDQVSAYLSQQQEPFMQPFQIAINSFIEGSFKHNYKFIIVSWVTDILTQQLIPEIYKCQPKAKFKIIIPELKRPTMNDLNLIRRWCRVLN